MMATEIRADGNAVGMTKLVSEDEAPAPVVSEMSTVPGALQQFDRDALGKSDTLLEGGEVDHANKTVTNVSLSMREGVVGEQNKTHTGEQNKTHMIRRQKKQPFSKMYAVIRSDAQDVEILHDRPDTFAEPEAPLETLLEQNRSGPPPLVQAGPAPVAAAAPAAVVPGTAAAPAAAPAPPAASTTTAKPEEGSIIGATIYYIVVVGFASAVIVVVALTSYLCYGAFMELRRRNEGSSDAEPQSPRRPPSRQSVKRFSQRFHGRLGNPPTRGRALTSGQNSDTSPKSFSSSKRESISSRPQDDDEEPMVQTGSISTNSVILQDVAPYKYRHKQSRMSALQPIMSGEPAVLSTPTPRNEGDSGSTSYKSRHKASRNSYMGNTLSLPRSEAGMTSQRSVTSVTEDIEEEHEF